MKRRILVCLGLVLFVVLAGCSTTTPPTFPPPETTLPPKTIPAETESPPETTQKTSTPTETTTPSLPEPQPEPQTFEPIVITGSGDKTSPPFSVTTDEWIIDWSFIPNPEYPELAVFGFFIYPRGETVSFVESVSFADEEGSTYSYAGSGEYYLEVIAANIEGWEVVVRPAE